MFWKIRFLPVIYTARRIDLQLAVLSMIAA